MKTIIKLLVLSVLLAFSAVSTIDKKQKFFRGYTMYIVRSGSMGSFLQKGSIAFVKKDNVIPTISTVITFRSPLNINEFITHRVVGYDEEAKGGLLTKGDSNKTIDPWIVTPDNVVGRVVGKIPLIGYFVWFVQSPLGLILLVIIPCVYLILNEVDALSGGVRDCIVRNRYLKFKLRRILTRVRYLRTKKRIR